MVFENAWNKFTSNTPLRTGDLVIVKDDKRRELAFINSGLSTDDPTGLSSIPESWSCDITASDINHNYPRMKECDIDGIGHLILGTNKIKDINGDIIYVIEKFMRVRI